MPILYYHTIFFTFLKLGCLSFGGPAAHLVFFHQTFVKQLNWLDDQQYAQLVALAQILPGPTSSQVGLAIGYMKKGYWGALLAWLGFTLPSALLMTMVALLGEQFFPLLSSAFFHS
ncbi:MAG: chromate transporter, partial [Christensenellaceae bacterium]